jgi:glycosyltransferase involved in cell wall biosynthesis
MGMRDQVVLPGLVARDVLLTAYHNARALLLPLFGDAQSQARFPTKLGEYLLSGRPVVTSATGEVPSLLTHCETAFIAPPDSTEAFAEAINVALNEPEVASRVGQAGRKLAVDRLDYRAHGAVLAAWLRQLRMTWAWFPT